MPPTPMSTACKEKLFLTSTSELNPLQQRGNKAHFPSLEVGVRSRSLLPAAALEARPQAMGGGARGR